jgi:hypothetical protein
MNMPCPTQRVPHSCQACASRTSYRQHHGHVVLLLQLLLVLLLLPSHLLLVLLLQVWLQLQVQGRHLPPHCTLSKATPTLIQLPSLCFRHKPQTA